MRIGLLCLVLALVLTEMETVPPVAAQGTEETAVEMTTYYVGLIYRGPQWGKEVTPEVMELQKAHLANIQRMAKMGKLVLAGPFLDDGELRGMYVFQVDSRAEAEELCKTDPAVKAGRLRIELHPWYSARGIRSDASPPNPNARQER